MTEPTLEEKLVGTQNQLRAAQNDAAVGARHTKVCLQALTEIYVESDCDTAKATALSALLTLVPLDRKDVLKDELDARVKVRKVIKAENEQAAVEKAANNPGIPTVS